MLSKFQEPEMEMENSFASESSSVFQMIPSSNPNPKLAESELTSSMLQTTSTSQRRRSWPPGSPKAHTLLDNHGIFVTYDDTEDYDVRNNQFNNKGCFSNSFHHNDVTATRSLASKIPKIKRVQRSDRQSRKSRKNINNNVAERVSLFKALVHVDGENSSNGLGSEASRGIGEAVSGSGESGNGNYRQFDDMLMEGHSGGSIRALAVEAAFVANGILRRSAQQGKIKTLCKYKNYCI